MIYLDINTTLTMRDSTMFNVKYQELLDFLNGPCSCELVYRTLIFANHIRLHFKSKEDKAEFILKYM